MNEQETIPLPREQRVLMNEFYSVKPTKIILRNEQRKEIYNKISQYEDSNFDYLKQICPALEYRIRKDYKSLKNVKSVINQCIYAQTYANMLNLKFINCEDNPDYLPMSVKNYLHSLFISPDYVYASNDKQHLLIQAGGRNGLDSVLLIMIDFAIYTVEFRKTYKEPFSTNYDDTKMFADLTCTKDKNDYLVMIPSNQVLSWRKKNLRKPLKYSEVKSYYEEML